MNRRQLIAAGGAWAALAGKAWADDDDLRAAAREAWLYCLPLIEMATTRARATSPDSEGRPRPANAFVHARKLANPASRAVTTPNCDTLYSAAWLDLSAGPITLILPSVGDRYFSLALMDMFTNNFAVLGRRETGGRRGVYTIVGPRGSGPSDAIRSPTPWVWALGRTLVDGPDDLGSAWDVQDGLRLRARSGRIPERGAGRTAVWSDYFLRAQALLEENPPPPGDADFFGRIAPLQLGQTHGFEDARFADVEVGDIEAGVSDARATLQGQRPRVVDGWVYPQPDLGDYGRDYLYRAAVALSGLGALPPAEALYMRAADPNGGTVLTGDGYRLTLPEPPPAQGFWSLTMYEAAPDGQLFLTPNVLNRYAIGDRTPGLARGPDGALDIWISRVDPGGERSANWLPAPAEGPFSLTLRAYLPGPEMLHGVYRLPPLQAIGQDSPQTIAAPPPPAPPPMPQRRRRPRR